MSVASVSGRNRVVARLADSSPEGDRRRAMWKAAKGERRVRIAEWNRAWNRAHRPADFPDFPAWLAQQKPD